VASALLAELAASGFFNHVTTRNMGRGMSSIGYSPFVTMKEAPAQPLASVRKVRSSTGSPICHNGPTLVSKNLRTMNVFRLPTRTVIPRAKSLDELCEYLYDAGNSALRVRTGLRSR
jgi:hypothetical protein